MPGVRDGKSCSVVTGRVGCRGQLLTGCDLIENDLKKNKKTKEIFYLFGIG